MVCDTLFIRIYCKRLDLSVLLMCNKHRSVHNMNGSDESYSFKQIIHMTVQKMRDSFCDHRICAMQDTSPHKWLTYVD